MSVEIATKVSTDAETPIGAPGDAERQDGPPQRRGRGPTKRTAPPKQLVLLYLCDDCGKAIRGTDAGYGAVNLREAALAMSNPHAPKARWHVAHKVCLPKALAPLGGWFVVWCTEIVTTDDVLDVMVTLAGQRWFNGTDWARFVRKVKADTETAATHSSARAEADIAAYRSRHDLPPAPRPPTPVAPVYEPRPDAEHGTNREYHRGCRCQDCRAAHTEANRANRRERQSQEIER